MTGGIPIVRSPFLGARDVVLADGKILIGGDVDPAELVERLNAAAAEHKPEPLPDESQWKLHRIRFLMRRFDGGGR